VGWIADLLKEVPAAAKYRAQLDEMEQENRRLKAENGELSEELAQFIHSWVTLDWDAVRTLVYLAQHERAHASEIAQAYEMNAHLVESHLNYLVAGHFVHAPVNGEPCHSLAHKGRRYLRERGLAQ
jgi:hypothetical protein